jgi:hypothetical protein
VKPGHLISVPGAYPNVPAADYHGREICDSPSIGSSGLKLIDWTCPAKYWAQCPQNPRRVMRKDTRPFRIGRGLHDLLLVDGAVPNDYHLVPDGFVSTHTTKWDGYIPAWREATAAGKTVLSVGEFKLIQAMAEAVSSDPLAKALITAGTPEMTLCARDPNTGVWMRARPDVLPDVMEIIPDVKTAIDASADAYEREASNNGYFLSAAHYMDVIGELYPEGADKRRFVLITVEKTYPHLVTIDHLDNDDLNQARMVNRSALNKFAHGVKTGEWPGYTTPEHPIRQLHMSAAHRARINQRVELGELSYD